MNDNLDMKINKRTLPSATVPFVRDLMILFRERVVANSKIAVGKFFYQLKYKTFILVSILFVSEAGNAAFQWIEVGARPIGMNGAYTAVADDVNSVIYNVAGLGKLTRSEVSTIYSVLLPGINDSLGMSGIAYVQPLPAAV